MGDITSDAQDKYIPIDKAMRLLHVRSERITWFIATGRLAFKVDSRDRSRKLVSLQEVLRLRNSPHLLAPWIIYALVDPKKRRCSICRASLRASNTPKSAYQERACGKSS